MSKEGYPYFVSKIRKPATRYSCIMNTLKAAYTRFHSFLLYHLIIALVQLARIIHYIFKFDFNRLLGRTAECVFGAIKWYFNWVGDFDRMQADFTFDGHISRMPYKEIRSALRGVLNVLHSIALERAHGEPSHLQRIRQSQFSYHLFRHCEFPGIIAI